MDFIAPIQTFRGLQFFEYFNIYEVVVQKLTKVVYLEPSKAWENERVPWRRFKEAMLAVFGYHCILFNKFSHMESTVEVI